MDYSLKILSIVVYVIILVAFANRKRVKVHVPMMAAAFVIDVAMVLYIELTRHAIETAVGPTSPVMKIHIALSVITVVLYVGQIITGIKKAKGQTSAWHGKAGAIFLLARLGNLITSFLIG